MARNRYGWQKRAKEMARKQKNDEKMKRRQGKALETPLAEDASEGVEVGEGVEELSLNETDPAGLSLRQES